MIFEAALPLTAVIPYFIGFIVLLVGSYTDFKTREVPDWVNFGLIGIGFGINLLFTIVYWKINFNWKFGACKRAYRIKEKDEIFRRRIRINKKRRG